MATFSGTKQNKKQMCSLVFLSHNALICMCQRQYSSCCCLQCLCILPKLKQKI